ncbi:hypothetical protein K4B79_06220 [Streptomyces lincolnensis]|uniref:hypothetical protein n=1 Tax=Streptomyces lincolnensis TaxID=1915 RepID=UPI001E3BAFDC|nr:hypothetical protein [Streptomyces lincolnensis]MCD7437819.1 hypothetical protein [Streptomyces lincolnensis]
MIQAPASRRPLLWGTAMALGAALGGQGLMAAPAASDARPVAVSGYTYVERASATNSTPSRSVRASCPRGKVILAGGARIVDGGNRVLLRGSYPVRSHRGHGWAVSAEELGALNSARWSVRAYAVCANRPLGLQYRTVSSGSDSKSPKSPSSAVCPRGTRLIGLGASVAGVNHPIGINAITVTSSRSASVRASEALATSLRWRVRTHIVCAELGQTYQETDWKTVPSPAQAGTALAVCPRGTKAFGAGVRVSAIEAAFNRLVPVEVRPTLAPSGARTTVSELASGMLSHWHLKAQVICVR